MDGWMYNIFRSMVRRFKQHEKTEDAGTSWSLTGRLMMSSFLRRKKKKLFRFQTFILGLNMTASLKLGSRSGAEPCRCKRPDSRRMGTETFFGIGGSR